MIAMASGGRITRGSIASAVVAAALLFALLVWRRDAAPRLERATRALSPSVGVFNPVTGGVASPGEARSVSPSVGPAIVPPPATEAQRRSREAAAAARSPAQSWPAADAGAR